MLYARERGKIQTFGERFHNQPREVFLVKRVLVFRRQVWIQTLEYFMYKRVGKGKAKVRAYAQPRGKFEADPSFHALGLDHNDLFTQGVVVLRFPENVR